MAMKWICFLLSCPPLWPYATCFLNFSSTLWRMKVHVRRRLRYWSQEPNESFWTWGIEWGNRFLCRKSEHESFRQTNQRNLLLHARATQSIALRLKRDLKTSEESFPISSRCTWQLPKSLLISRKFIVCSICSRPSDAIDNDSYDKTLTSSERKLVSKSSLKLSSREDYSSLIRSDTNR